MPVLSLLSTCDVRFSHKCVLTCGSDLNPSSCSRMLDSALQLVSGRMLLIHTGRGPEDELPGPEPVPEVERAWNRCEARFFLELHFESGLAGGRGWGWGLGLGLGLGLGCALRSGRSLGWGSGLGAGG